MPRPCPGSPFHPTHRQGAIGGSAWAPRGGRGRRSRARSRPPPCSGRCPSRGRSGARHCGVDRVGRVPVGDEDVEPVLHPPDVGQQAAGRSSRRESRGWGRSVRRAPSCRGAGRAWCSPSSPRRRAKRATPPAMIASNATIHPGAHASRLPAHCIEDRQVGGDPEIVQVRWLTPAPDLGWSPRFSSRSGREGDFAKIGNRPQIVGEHLCETVGVIPASGSSTSPAEAATQRSPRRGDWADVVGVDYVPELLANGRERAAAEGLEASSSRVTRRRSRSTTRLSTSCSRPSARCSRRIRRRRPRSCFASAGPAGGSGWPTGHRRAWSAACSRPRQARAAPPGVNAAVAMGHRGAGP